MRSAFALALLLGALGFAGKADAQALCHTDRHEVIPLRYKVPECRSWVACPNPYGPLYFAAPWDQPGMPAGGAPLPPMTCRASVPTCFQTPCERWCSKWTNCDACKGPISPYGYPEGNPYWVRSPRDYFMQPGR